MAILSILRKGFVPIVNQATIKSICKKNSVVVNSIRQCGYDPRKMYLAHSKRSYQKFNDMAHFYLTIGTIPLALITLYANISIGPAKLAVIPESYDPKEWEYHRHPISRWFSKYLYSTKQEAYEKYMYQMWAVDNRVQMDLIESKVTMLRNRRQDSEDSYTNRRMTLEYAKLVREEEEYRKDHTGRMVG